MKTPEAIQRAGAELGTQPLDIMQLMARAPWREAVTCRETWPHEYVVIQRGGQEELLAESCRRILRAELNAE